MRLSYGFFVFAVVGVVTNNGEVRTSALARLQPSEDYYAASGRNNCICLT